MQVVHRVGRTKTAEPFLSFGNATPRRFFRSVGAGPHVTHPSADGAQHFHLALHKVRSQLHGNRKVLLFS